MRLWWVLLTGLLTGVAGQSLQQQTVQDDGSRIESVDTTHEDASHKVFEGIEVTEEAKEESNNTEMPWWQASGDLTNKEEMNMTVVEASSVEPHNNTDPVAEEPEERPLTKKEQRATQKYNNAADVVLKALAKAMKKAEPFPVSLQEATLQNLRELDEAPSSQTDPQPEEETQKEKRRRKKNKKRRGNKNKGGKSDLAESENNKKNKNQDGEEEVEEPVRRRKKNKKNKNKNKNRNKNKDKDTTDEDEAVQEGGDTSALSVEEGKREKQHGKGKNKNKRNKNKRKKNRKNKKKNKGAAASTRDAKALGDYEEEDPEVYTEEVEDVEGRRKGGHKANKKNGKGKKGKRGKKNKNKNKKNKKNRKNKKNKGKNSGSKSRSEPLDLEENTGPVLPTQDEMETSNARLTGFSNLARSQDVSVDLSGNQPQFEATFTVGPLKVEMADKARDLTKTQVSIILSARALFKAKNVRTRDKLKLLSMEMLDMTQDTVSVSRSGLIFESEMVSTVQEQVVQAVDVPRIGRILAHELETIFQEEDILQNLEEKLKN